MFRLQDRTALIPDVRSITLTLIEREDDTRRMTLGVGLHIYNWPRQPSICQDISLRCCPLRCCPSNHHVKDHKDQQYITMQRTTKTNSTRLIPSIRT
jgi:hypothetical protein